MMKAVRSSPIHTQGMLYYTISVADSDQSIHWYHRILGFRPIKTTILNGEKTTFLQNKGIMLKMVQVPAPKPIPPYRMAPNTDNAVQGHKHFSVKVKDGRQAESELKALGVPIVFIAKVDDTYGNFICDPTGNLIEVLQEELPKSPAGLKIVPGTGSIALEGWSHVAISVPDTQKSVDWYKAKFGFSLLHTHGVDNPGKPVFKVTWMKAPNFSLEIFEIGNSIPIPEDRLNPETDLKTKGNKYFCLGVDDIQDSREKLSLMGLEVIRETAGEKGSLFIRDNAGILIELKSTRDYLNYDLKN
jgi:methylmalonyl-CoA/ethylmalonyl-CoA epimerase